MLAYIISSPFSICNVLTVISTADPALPQPPPRSLPWFWSEGWSAPKTPKCFSPSYSWCLFVGMNPLSCWFASFSGPGWCAGCAAPSMFPLRSWGHVEITSTAQGEETQGSAENSMCSRLGHILFWTPGSPSAQWRLWIDAFRSPSRHDHFINK